ncbi:MBL fold metallo-hydrolase [Caldimonas aquatica]|uniref:MBL fold metallo-hydrolase n=1 Tax=Caldimonas aquatica TaxID=376175 RepID=A0ABY6MR81_9BURK|nr:MBL fold metallo-hydrolase [Schlegelella aquatica]UZD54511.1 MBL fold metallo-hydrolase [Schlegelella aquatica]
MNPLEQRLDYPLADRLPETGRSLEVAPGVRWVRMGLPFALDHINLWLLRDEQEGQAGWTIVDCGITSDATRAAWESVFEHELQGLPVLRVIVTHMHPDHIGLAHWLTERWGAGGRDCRLWISATDFNAARIASQSTTGFGGEAAARFFASHGLTDPDSLQKVRARANYYASMVPQVPAQFRRLMDGAAVDIGGRPWRCIAGYGHSPEHISLYCDELRVLISGDMLLPRISTNVSVIDLEPEANPLPLYLGSVHALTALPTDTLVLPSHGRPFRGLHERVRQLKEHHDLRLAEVMQACAERPCSAADLLPVLFKRTLDLHQTTFAIGEAIAHLHALWFDGRLRRIRGEDGVFRFAPA